MDDTLPMRLREVSLGYRGYSVEVMAYGKRTFGLNRLVAITSRDNYGSAKLLEKLGFSFERMVNLSDDGAAASLFASDV